MNERLCILIGCVNENKVREQNRLCVIFACGERKLLIDEVCLVFVLSICTMKNILREHSTLVRKEGY